MDIGRKVREVREDLGMPAAELARRVGVAPNTVWRYESGEREPSMAMLEKIARELRTEPAELMRDPALGAGKGEALQGTRRDEWDAAVRNARQLRKHAQGRTEELLALWQESKSRKEDPAERRAYLDEIRELLQQAYDARPTLFEAMSYERLPEQWPELGEADQFYRGLWDLVQSAGLNIRTGKAQEERPKAVDEPEAA